MDTLSVYAQILTERIQAIVQTQREALENAAEHIAQAIAQDRRVHVLGGRGGALARRRPGGL